MLLCDCRYAFGAYPRAMLTQLRAFLVVIEEGSLNRAAARLRTSQSALTRQMQALEHEVGGRLLERSSTGVELTGAGHVIAASMRRVLAEYDAAMAEAGQAARGEREQLRVGYLASAAQAYLDPALAALRREHPHVRVKLLNLSPGEQIAALRKGEIDVALIGQEGCLAAREFYTRKLATLPVLAVLPAGHPLAGQKTIRLAELRGERFVRSPEEDLPGRDRWIARLCRATGFRPKFGAAAESLSHALTLIASEGAVTLAPDYLRAFPAGGVVMRPLAEPGVTWDFLVVWHRGRTSASLNALLEALEEAAKIVCQSARGLR